MMVWVEDEEAQKRTAWVQGQLRSCPSWNDAGLGT